MYTTYTELAKAELDFIIRQIIALFPTHEREQLLAYYERNGTTEGFHHELYRHSYPITELTEEDLDLGQYTIDKDKRMCYFILKEYNIINTNTI